MKSEKNIKYVFSNTGRKSILFACCVYVFVLCRMVITLVYYGLSFSAGQLAGNRYVNNFLSGIVEIPAYIISFFILGR